MPITKERVEKTCPICKKIVVLLPGKAKLFKVCSVDCRKKYMFGHRPFNWKGGRLVHKGYVYLLVKNHPMADRDGYVSEHRIVMEKKLGRLLNEREIVHHKNRNRGDNRIENLEVLDSQSTHMKVHHPKGTHIYQGDHPKGMLGKKKVH